ncbi:MAG: 16S rRNA (cytosine(1402)-N(4))-methyltransferase RsmH [Parachlamydiaceae bacterium]|nr:16S rRNA (cytosine(1402)-N(4))-methyltransferase RsmH [Parachlamydiaceae bacterium]
MTTPHLSVLRNEIVESFSSCSLSYFVDGTLGAGGHSEAILETHPELKTLIGIDQDEQALEIARHRLMPWNSKVHFASGNFSQLSQILQSIRLPQVNGILLDIGVSSMQLDQAEKGFSFMRNGPLDMRMNIKDPLTAAEIVNTWPEKELGRIFREYGEEKQWRSAAQAIVKARAINPILTTHALADILRPHFFWKKKGVNPLTLIFQALRICVNRELEVLEAVIPQAIEKLAPQGRLAIISFHSLEDRIVKNAFRFAASDKESTSGIGGIFLTKIPTVKLLHNRPIIPTDEEIAQNPRSRSAKLRVLEKL